MFLKGLWSHNSSHRLLRHSEDVAEGLGDRLASLVIGAVEGPEAHGGDALQLSRGYKLELWKVLSGSLFQESFDSQTELACA